MITQASRLVGTVDGGLLSALRRSSSQRALSKRQRAGMPDPARIGAGRGMVTVELVFGMLIVSTVVAIFGWAIMLFGIQIGCVDTATQIARQSARGDQAAVQQAEERAPRDAKITIDQGSEQVEVTVQVRSRPIEWIPPITLRAEATAQLEPGE